MISLFSGTPGSGKSLHIASIIYNRCRHDAFTIGNFEINRDLVDGEENYLFVDNEELLPDKLVEIAQEYFGVDDNGVFDFHKKKFKEGEILLIIDEAQLLFNVREWNLAGRSGWIHFFTQHRKLGYNVIIVAQFDKMIDKQLRSLFEYEYIHRKMSNFGWKGKLISIWTANRMFMCVKRWYPLNERIGSESFLYHKHLGELYNTREIFHKPETVKIAQKKNSDPEKVFVQNDEIDEIITYEKIG